MVKGGLKMNGTYKFPTTFPITKSTFIFNVTCTKRWKLLTSQLYNYKNDTYEKITKTKYMVQLPCS
jgi:hypothetical protein